MRTLSFSMNITIDGYCDHTLGIPSAEVHDYFTQLLDDVDLLFFGRVMYELMFPYWSDVAKNQSGTPDEIQFGEKITSIEKVVISKTLETADYNTRIIRSNPVEELLKLRHLPGKKISVDSVSLLPELIAAGLIDEFNIVVHPVIAGKGRRLLDTELLRDKLVLKLVETVKFQNGCVAHQYAR
ncbi:dihydrofolate reductase family protein [Dyadobacter crusticola]|uniref:dihydrofolate reductase family protein n=1 Tax=Dyadobacter crusticola TaxID=292407 RepID=UPI000690834D|nr:dihydrofolate reductase family protein [Dyadobacter crusticola]